MFLLWLKSSSLIFHGKKSVKSIINATSLEAQFDSFKKLLLQKD